MGYGCHGCPNMLHQVRATGSPAADARDDCRSEGVYYAFKLKIGITHDAIQRPETNELSLALVPRDHPLIPPPKLEPEALGLLDRLLDVFSEQARYVIKASNKTDC